jgi:transposase
VAGGSGRSPFQITLGAAQRRWLKALVGKPTAQQRQVTRARIVLLAASGWTNAGIARKLGIAPNTASKWRKRYATQGVDGLRDRKRPGRPRVFAAPIVAEVKAIAWELPVTRGVPISRWSLQELRTEVIGSGLVEAVSTSPLGGWLAEDAIKPWRYHSWIFPRARTSPPRPAVFWICTSAASRANCWATTSRCCRRMRRPRSRRAAVAMRPGQQARRGVCAWSTNTTAVERWRTWPPGMSTTPTCSAAASPPRASTHSAGWSPRS